MESSISLTSAVFLSIAKTKIHSADLPLATPVDVAALTPAALCGPRTTTLTVMESFKAKLFPCDGTSLGVTERLPPHFWL